MTDDLIHLPRAMTTLGPPLTFCNQQMENGTKLTVNVDNATCDPCIAAVLAERATVPDLRREGAKTGLENFLHQILGSNVRVVTADELLAGAAGTVLGGRALEHFSIENLTQRGADQVPDKYDFMVELPAYVASTREHFPHPISAVLSLMTFYLEVLRAATREKTVPDDIAIERTKEVSAITAFIKAEIARLEIDFTKTEYPLTAEQWEEKL